MGSIGEEGRRRYFTIEQANASLKVIRPLMERMMRIRQIILDKQPAIWPVLEKAAGNGGSKLASEVQEEFVRLDAALREIQATGAVVKDINTGLVDFLARLENRDVYLCWRYGEERVTFWHEIDAGFAGRQPLQWNG